MSSSDKLHKSDIAIKPFIRHFHYTPRVDFSRLISDEDVESILKATQLRRSKSNSRGRFSHPPREKAFTDTRKKAQTPSPHKPAISRGKSNELDLCPPNEYVKTLLMRCNTLEDTISNLKNAHFEEKSALETKISQITTEMEKFQTELKLLRQKLTDRSKSLNNLSFFLIDLLQNLLENKVLNTSRLQSIASSFDSSLEGGLTLEDDEKRRVADQIRELLREKLVLEMMETEGDEIAEVVRRIEQWNLPTPNSSTWEVRSSNKSPASSRTDSFVMYPDAVVSFRNLMNSPDLCMSPTFQQPEPPAVLGSSFSFESIDPVKGDDAGSPEPKESVALALYDFQGERSEDLSFRAGQRIEVLHQNPNGWWTGRVSGKEGVFPFNYVEMQ